MQRGQPDELLPPDLDDAGAGQWSLKPSTTTPPTCTLPGCLRTIWRESEAASLGALTILWPVEP